MRVRASSHEPALHCPRRTSRGACASSIEVPVRSASRTRAECLLNVSDAAVTVTLHILARAARHPGGLPSLGRGHPPPPPSRLLGSRHVAGGHHRRDPGAIARPRVDPRPATLTRRFLERRDRYAGGGGSGCPPPLRGRYWAGDVQENVEVVRRAWEYEMFGRGGEDAVADFASDFAMNPSRRRRPTAERRSETTFGVRERLGRPRRD